MRGFRRRNIVRIEFQPGALCSCSARKHPGRPEGFTRLATSELSASSARKDVQSARRIVRRRPACGVSTATRTVRSNASVPFLQRGLG